MNKREDSIYRWFILICIVPIIISTEMMWLTFAPISSVAEAYYHVSGIAITFFTASYMIMFILFCIPASWVIDRFGFRVSLIVGALLTAVFGLTRAYFSDFFIVVMISQFLIAIGQPFLLNISTKVPANWFPVSERATAAGILTMAQYLGFALPMLLAPIIAENHGIRAVLTVFAIISVISAIVAILFTREKPKWTVYDAVVEKEDFSFNTFKTLKRNKAYMLTLVICFISIGIFNTILTLIETILLPKGIDAVQIGIIGAVFVIAGVLGAILLPVLSDHLKMRMPFFTFSLVMLVPLYLGISLIANFQLLVGIAGVTGFLIMGVAPILFQHGSEVAYPVQEGTSLGVVLLMGQISGILFVFLFEVFTSAFGSIIPPMLFIVLITALEIPLTLKMSESSLLKGSVDECLPM